MINNLLHGYTKIIDNEANKIIIYSIFHSK